MKRIVLGKHTNALHNGVLFQFTWSRQKSDTERLVSEMIKVCDYFMNMTEGHVHNLYV